MAMADQQKLAFQERLGRIRRGAPNTLGQLYCGVAEERKAKEAIRFKGARRSITATVARESLMLPFSLFLGGATILAARIGLYRYLPEGGELAVKLGTVGEYLNGGFGAITVGVLLALIFCGIFRTLKGVRAAASCVGFAAILAGEGVLVEQYPDIWATLYSPEFVTEYAALGQIAHF